MDAMTIIFLFLGWMGLLCIYAVGTLLPRRGRKFFMAGTVYSALFGISIWADCEMAISTLFLGGISFLCVYMTGFLLPSKKYKIFVAGIVAVMFIWTDYTVAINIYGESKLEVLETDTRYEVLKVIQEQGLGTVYGISEDGKIITGPIYEICYDENAEIMYAVEVSERYGISDIAKKIALLEEKENYFRIYTDNRSYVARQSIYYIMERKDNM